jgi:uncharacterized membrane protein HdeD (DUF308 family)
MSETLLHAWWMLALRGVIAIVFGALALMWPGLTLLALIILFAAYAMAGGVVWVIGAVRHRRTDRYWWIPLLFGLLSIGAGVIALVYPTLTALALVLLMGANAVVSGVIDIVLAIRLRRHIPNEFLLVLVGVVSLAFGIMVLMFPAGGALALVWLVSAYAILAGVLFVALSLRVRTWSRLNIARSSPAAGALSEQKT